MAGEKNFNVKNGLSVGGVEVINSSGDLVAAGVGTAVNEAIADKIGGIISATGGATATYNDGADTIVIDVPITDEDNMASNSATAIASQQSIKAYVDSQVTAQDLDVASDSGSIDIDLDSESFTIAGGAGIDTSATGTTLTIAGELATETNAGIATFDGTDFTVSSGDVTVNAERIQDIVGAMVSSYTESGITVAYEDGDGTIDFTVGTLNQDTTGNAATATALETARNIHGVSFDGTGNIDLTEVIQDTVGAMVSSNTESGITVAYEDGDGTIDFTVGTLNQNTTGSAATLTTARTIHGVSFDGSANIDLTEVVQDTVGAMFTSNTETNIAATYQDGDGTIDLVVGDTTGNSATATALETARAIAVSGDVVGTANFDGTADISISTTIQANSVALGTDTTGNYMSDVSAGTGVTVSHTAGAVSYTHLTLPTTPYV